MADVKAMRDDLERMKARAQAILDEHKNGLTAEANAEVTALLSKAAELRGEMQIAAALEDKKKDLEDLSNWLDAPQHRVPHGVGEGEDDTKSALRKAGWEIKSGWVHAPTSIGVEIPLYPMEVLIGDIPQGLSAEEHKFFETTRRAFQPDYRAAFERHLRLIGKYHGEYSMMWTALTPAEQKALSEGTDTAGGFLVPPDVQAELLVRTAQQAAVRRAGARVQPTSRDLLRFPMVAAASATAGGLSSGGGSIFSSGFIGTWAVETPTFTDTDPSFGSFDVPVKKLRVATRLSNDFISDALVNVLAFLAENGASNAALVEDQGFLTGLGAALQPLGILNAGIATVDVEGSTVDTFGNTTSNAGSAPKVLDVEYALPSQYTPGAAWMMRRAIEGKLRKLVDGQGRFLYNLGGGLGPTATTGQFSRPPKELEGYPVYNSEFMPNDGTNGNQVLLFGDFSGYVIAQRAQITSTILRERFADTDQTGIILWERVGGAVWNPDQFRVGIV